MAGERRRLPWPLVVGSGVVLVIALGLLVVALVAGLTAEDELTAAEVIAYEDKIGEPTAEGGKVVQLGLKVGLSDLGGERKTAPAVIADQARAWTRDLERVRAQLSAIDPPRRLRLVHADLLRSLTEYAGTAELIERAARAAEGTDRDALLDEAAARGRAADRTYDRAGTALQEARRSLGLGPSYEFPQSTR